MPQDLDSLISSTLTALDSPPNSALKEEDEVSDCNDVDECLTKIREAAPEVISGEKESEDSFSKLLDGLLSPNAIFDSMEGLASEMAIYLEGREDSEENRKYRRQLEIYEEVSVEYKKDSNVSESSSDAGKHVRVLLEELQTLGSPPMEVVEKLMIGNESGGDEDIGKEFEEFLKSANIPGLSKEDEDIIKQLTSDPNALKNLLGSTQPGDCVIC